MRPLTALAVAAVVALTAVPFGLHVVQRNEIAEASNRPECLESLARDGMRQEGMSPRTQECIRRGAIVMSDVEALKNR